MKEFEGIGVELNGLNLIGQDAQSVWWTIQDIEGWDVVPETEGDVTQKVFADGAWISPTFWRAKPLRIKGTVRCFDRPTLRNALHQLNAALPKNLARLTVSEDGSIRHRFVRIEGAQSVGRIQGHAFIFDIQLIAPDPRIFGGDGSSRFEQSRTVALPSTTGGLIPPFTVPFSIDAVVVGNSVTVDAVGDAPPPVLVRFDGPVVGPVVRDGLGGVMRFDLSLDAGQWLDVDLDARTVKINGVVNRRNALRGAWIVPRPGMVLSFDASVYNPAASMTVSWTSASY